MKGAQDKVNLTNSSTKTFAKSLLKKFTAAIVSRKEWICLKSQGLEEGVYKCFPGSLQHLWDKASQLCSGTKSITLRNTLLVIIVFHVLPKLKFYLVSEKEI